jgi:hypothetical protein
MILIDRVRTVTQLAVMLGHLTFVEPCVAQSVPTPSQSAALPSETPAKFAPVTDSFDYVRRDVMIPMVEQLF